MKILQKLKTFFKNNKIVRRISYLVLVLIGIYLLFLTVLSIYINTNKAKFIAQVNEQLSNNIQGKVSIKNADVAVFRSFPRLAVVLQNIVITDSVYHMPFLQMKQADVRFGLLSVLGNTTRIGSVILKDGQIHILTDTAGYTNTYVLKGNIKADTSKTKKTLLIKNIQLENVLVLSEHKIRNKRFELKIKKLDADIKQKDSAYYIKMNENCFIKGLGFNLAKGSYLNNQTLEAKWRIKYNTATSVLSFNETKININKQPFNIKGTFWLSGAPRFNLHVTSNNLRYKQAQQLLPQNISAKFNKIQLSKPLNLVASIVGPMGYHTVPEVNVQWLTKLTQLTTPVTVFDSCTFSGRFTNRNVKSLPQSNENSAILIKSFIGTWGDIPLKGENISVANLTKPLFRFYFQSKCTFPQLDEQLALQTIHFLEGKAQLALSYNGPLITDAALFSKLEVDLKMENGKVEYEPKSLLFTNCNGEIIFSENQLAANNFKCDVNENHFVVNIQGDDLSKLSNSVSGKSNITCSVFSPSINLADFTSVFSQKKYVKRKETKKQNSAPSSLQIDKILSEGSLQLNLRTNNLQFNKFIASNVHAQLLFQENSWQIEQAFLQHANGSMNVSAQIVETRNNSHDAKVNAIIKNIDVKKLFYSFNNFGQQGITYSNIQGIINSKANISVKLDNKGAVIPGTMQGIVDFSIKNGALINFAPLQRIQEYVFKKRDLRHISFAELKNRLDIRGYDITINRMEIQSSALTVFVEGIYSLKNNTDISIQVPFSTLKKRDEDKEYIPVNSGANSKAGRSIYLRAKPDKTGQIKVGLDLFKKYKKEKSRSESKR